MCYMCFQSSSVLYAAVLIAGGQTTSHKPFEAPNDAIPILFGVECNVHYPFLGNKVKTKAIAQLHYLSDVYKVLHSLLHWHTPQSCIA